MNMLCSVPNFSYTPSFSDTLHHRGSLSLSPPGGAGARFGQDRLKAAAQQLLALGRLREAWDVCLTLRTPELYQQMARRALELLELDFAVRAYRELGDVATVLALRPLIEHDDRHLVAGHVCLLSGYVAVCVCEVGGVKWVGMCVCVRIGTAL